MGRSAACLTLLHRASLGSHTKRIMNISSLHKATWLGATVVAAGLLGAAGCSSSSSSSPGASASATPANKTPSVRQIAFGSTLRHTFKQNGTGATTTGSLTQPDDIV